jgi:hypothetical protein
MVTRGIDVIAVITADCDDIKLCYNTSTVFWYVERTHDVCLLHSKIMIIGNASSLKTDWAEFWKFDCLTSTTVQVTLYDAHVK